MTTCNENEWTHILTNPQRIISWLCRPIQLYCTCPVSSDKVSHKLLNIDNQIFPAGIDQNRATDLKKGDSVSVLCLQFVSAASKGKEKKIKKNTPRLTTSFSPFSADLTSVLCAQLAYLGFV